jgi:hypothetical protein
LAIILEVGADIPEISRRMGLPLETVRYIYKERIINKRRMTVQRELEHDKLGLKHIQFVVTLDPEIEPLFYRGSLLSGVWEDVYAKTAYRIIPENQFFLDHLAPPALHTRLKDFYANLEDLGVLKINETYDCNRLIHSRMWVEDYNWDLPGWDFDWSPSSLKPPENIEDPPASDPVKFDKLDLLMVKDFEVDSDQTVADLAARNSISRPSAFWHFRKHVEAQGVFGKHRIRWLGTTRDSKTGQILQRQSFVGINFIAKELSSAEMMNVRAHLHSIPYLWSEQVGDTDYNAETFIPSLSLMEAFGFFSKILRPLGTRARIFTVDQSVSSNYSIHPHLFDDESDRWIYKGDIVLEGIRATLAGGSLGSGLKRKRKKGRPESYSG